MPDSPPESNGTPQGKMVLIIGPSGVGKSVILKALRKRHPELVFPRSATTRARRNGEDTDLYYFLSDRQFEADVQKDAFIEWARVHGGGRYGTLKEEILPPMEAGKTVVREVDVQGYESISANPLFAPPSAKFPLVSVFILPENRDQLIERIKSRAPITEKELARRIASMDKELAVAHRCTAQVVNREGRLEETVAEVEKWLI